MMLPEESGTLPHRPWTPMSLVNVRGPQAKRCGRDEAKRKSVRKRLPLRGSRCVGDSPRKPLRHHREAATARDGAKHHREAAPQRKARHHRGVTAGRETARLHREATPQRKAKHHRDEQRAEPAASRRATCRTDTIEKQLPPGKAQSTIGKQLHSAKQGTFGRSNLLNQQHREEQPAESAASGRALFGK